MMIIGVSTALGAVADTTVRDIGNGTLTLQVGGIALSLRQDVRGLSIIYMGGQGNLTVELVAANVMRISVKSE
jgi:hypothetical protein